MVDDMFLDAIWKILAILAFWGGVYTGSLAVIIIVSKARSFYLWFRSTRCKKTLVYIHNEIIDEIDLIANRKGCSREDIIARSIFAELGK